MIGTGLRIVSLFSGSSGNATLVASSRTGVLVDAGVAASRIAASLDALGIDIGKLRGALITHEHIDHIRAVGVLARRYDLPLYANASTWAAIDGLGCAGKIPQRNRIVIETGRDFFIGDLCISSFPISHDSAEPVGYVLWGEGKQAAIATDMGHMTDAVLSRLRDSDAVLLESNHDVDMLKNGRYPAALKRRILGRRGHLSNAAAASSLPGLLACGVRRVALCHISRDNNTPEAAWQAASDALEAAGARIGRDIDVSLTWHDRIGADWTL